MKVALCLSGQPRAFDGCFQQMKEYVIDPLDCDVFFHFWESPSEELGNTWKPKINSDWPSMTGARLNHVKRQLQPKAFMVEPQKIFASDDYRNDMEGCGKLQYSVPNILSMYYSIWQANLLRVRYEVANGFTYDKVIRARTDLMFREPIPQPLLNDPDIVIPSRYDNVDRSIVDEVEHGLFNDQCAIGNSTQMSQYADTFLLLNDLFHEGHDMHPETMLHASLKKQGLSASHAVWRFTLVRASS